jgi:UDPglucose 6-dehydrogenase
MRISMKIAIIGSGYVGLVTGACFAEVGHEVICVDNDDRKIKALRSGVIPIYEPGLEQLVQRNVSADRLSFTGSIEEGVDSSQVVFIAVPTPPQADGNVDMTYIERVAREIASVLKEYRVIVDKSTVPVKTGEKVADTIRRYNKVNVEFDVVSNPEFLREGCAVADLMKPDRIVIGSNSERALAIMKRVYEPFMTPIMVTDVNSAELIKHAANSFLALKISYINALSAICEASGADVEKVADGIGADKRIGRSFLNAGLGYGGSCFPKDIAAFISISEQIGEPFHLLREVQRINQHQRERFLKRIRDTLWVLKDKRIAVWGLTFKPDTDDVRNSVAVDLVNDLIREGAHVAVYDPKGNQKVQEFNLCPGVHLASSALEAVRDAETLVLATEWPDFAAVDMAEVNRRMHTPIVFDGRNLFDPDTMRDLGFQYHRIGHPPTKANSSRLSNGNTVRIPITLESGTTPIEDSSNRPRPPYLVKPSVI